MLCSREAPSNPPDRRAASAASGASWVKVLACVVALAIVAIALRPKAGPPLSIADTSWPNIGSTLPCDGSPKFWWVASDLEDGNVLTWTDRVQGSNFVTGTGTSANTPVKTDNYVAFNGTNYMTNAAISMGPSLGYSVALIYKPNGETGLQFFWIRVEDNFGFVFNISEDNRFYWNIGGGNIKLVNGGMNANILFDIICRDLGGSNWETSTNGVTVSTNAVVSALNLGRLSSLSAPLKGRIYEIQVYDCALTSDDVTVIHDYRVATYGE